MGFEKKEIEMETEQDKLPKRRLVCHCSFRLVRTFKQKVEMKTKAPVNRNRVGLGFKQSQDGTETGWDKMSKREVDM